MRVWFAFTLVVLATGVGLLASQPTDNDVQQAMRAYQDERSAAQAIANRTSADLLARADEAFQQAGVQPLLHEDVGGHRTLHSFSPGPAADS